MAAPVPGTPAWYRSRATPIPKKSRPSSPKVPLVTAQKPDPATVFGTPQWIDARVSEQIDPQVKALQDALKAQQAQNTQYQSALTGYYQALGGILRGEAPAVSAAYGAAAQGVGNIAQGYTQGLAQQYQNEASTVQAALERAGQQQAIPSTTALANPGTNPFFAIHGAIPGTTLEQQGAAAATEAAAQPRIWAARGADALTVAVQKAMEGDQAMQARLAEVYATVPAVRQKIEDSVRQYQLDVKAQQADAKLAQQKLALDKYKADTSYDARLRSINATIAKNNATLKQKELDRQTRVALANQNADLARERIAISREKAAAGSGSGVSTSQNNEALNASQAAALKAIKALSTRIWTRTPNSGLDSDSDDPKVQAQYAAAQDEYERRMDLNFGTAMTQVIRAISPYLKKAGYSQKEIKAQAYKYVTAGDGEYYFNAPKGYKPPTASNVSSPGYSAPIVTAKTGIVTSKPWKGTHVTDNLGWGTSTAADIMDRPGTPVGAPESGVIERWGSAQGGQSLYFRGDSGRVYWLGHIDDLAPVGTRVGVNQTIARISADHPRPHLHIDVRGANS